jgi:hypothetical protein
MDGEKCVKRNQWREMNGWMERGRWREMDEEKSMKRG